MVSIVLVLVIEKDEYAHKIRWGVEDEYKDEYESPARCALRVAGSSILDFRFGISDWKELMGLL